MMHTVQKTCFLLGFMGSGKSFLGRQLAGMLGVPFVDLDVVIEKAEGYSIAQLFAGKGEAWFRNIERRYLLETGSYPPCVVATGGGTPCFFENMDWMNRHGITVFLNVPEPVLASRLLEQRKTRPLLAGVPDRDLEAFIEKLLAERSPWYSQAQLTVEPGEDTSLFLENLAAKIRDLSV